METTGINSEATLKERRNNSTLSYADCANRLINENYAFEDMCNDDLDLIYFIAYNRWAYHLTREAYIQSLYKKRNDFKLREEITEILRDNITFSEQVGKYVIHGALDKLIELIDREKINAKKPV